MKDYILSIKIPIKALDDIQAREFAKVFSKIFKSIETKELKLQEIFNDKPPRHVNYED